LSLWRQPGDVRADRQLQERPGARAGDPGAARAMSFSAYAITFAPLVPWAAIGALAGIAALILLLGLWRRARGVYWRAAAVLFLLAIIANPAMVQEKRTPQRDVA